MNFQWKPLNLKAVGLSAFLVLVFLFAGWIWHRLAMNEQQKALVDAVGKYGGNVEFDGAGYEIENWLIKLKIANSAPYHCVEIFGTTIDLEGFLVNPVKLEISGSPAIDDDDLEKIASFMTIRSLELPVSTFGDPQAKILGRCRNLEYLDLTGVSLSDAGFAELGNLIPLKGFTFSNSVLSDRSCRVLLKMKRLTHLEIRRTSFTVEGLQFLVREHRSLREIIITEGVLRNEELEKLAESNPDIEVILTPECDPFKSLGLEAIFHSQK